MGEVVSERRVRKAMERVQGRATATYNDRIRFWFQPGMPEDLHGAEGSRLGGVHLAGMKAVLQQQAPPNVAVRLLMEGACFEVLAEHVGRPAGVLAPEVIYGLAVSRFEKAAKGYSEGWAGNFRAMSLDELGMCFTYAAHRMVRDVGPWPGSDEELWSAWQHTSQQWMSDVSGKESNSIVLAAGERPDPNAAFEYMYRRSH